jgi:hypothetical protein
MNRLVSAWVTAIIGVGVILTLVGWILRATIEVLHNRGAETYVNAKGMQVHWVDVLTMSVAALLALLVILVATAVFYWRRKRDLAQAKELDAKISAELLNRDN